VNINSFSDLSCDIANIDAFTPVGKDISKVGKRNMAVSIFWHRRDLRIEDNAGLFSALKGPRPVQSVFIFDKHILDRLEDKDDARVTFIHQEIQRVSEELQELGSSLKVYYGDPVEVWPTIISNYDVEAVYTNRDYEPYALDRDAQVSDLLTSHEVPLHTFKDHVIFEQDEVLKKDGGPYTVFTPYKRRWLERLDSRSWQEKDQSYYMAAYPNERYQSNYAKTEQTAIPSLADMGFVANEEIDFPERTVNQGIIRKYGEQRNFPAIDGTSRLGLHFRFGTISIRDKARRARGLSDVYLSELIWRDFYSQILGHFPHVTEGAFRPKYDEIAWVNDEAHFSKWCEGMTGYPLVDAGMRELNATGYMHNRVRMVVASFLTKHLLTDWRWGEAYFARKLLDFDLASNNGGWQWAAGSGTDAAPYFRIFNPTSQLEKFDKNLKYVKQWVPEYGSDKYPQPIVDHKWARERCLETYKATLKKD
jgi:deoxyribodipyrimidine photo-lyase